jgi:hypothetical protein
LYFGIAWLAHSLVRSAQSKYTRKERDCQRTSQKSQGFLKVIGDQHPMHSKASSGRAEKKLSPSGM